MCDFMNSPLISYGYGDNFTNFHKCGPTPSKFNSNPTFLASKSIMGYKDYLLTKFVRNPRMKELIFMNQRCRFCLCSSNGFDIDSKMRLKEEDGLGLEFSQDSEDGHSLQDVFNRLNVQKDGNDIEEKVKAKTRVLKGEGLILEEEENVEEVKLKRKGKMGSKSRKKQLIKRSNLLAKQVIGIQSALSLGFVSQLWIDTASWVVLEVEVRPSLLSSESGKVLLADIERVGDVVLVQDETFVLNEFRTVGLETLVGYNVVTPRGRNLGKVRGYTFDIDSGAVESLELDAFGYSIISSSLVSTYALFTEDVLQVVSDTIIVHETAASRMQRLTKGFLSIMNPEASNYTHEYDNVEEESVRPKKSSKSRKKSGRRKSNPGTRKLDDDLDLPMDYM